MTKKPKINLKRTTTDLILELLTLAVLIFSWVDIIIHYPKLPGNIPIHFNGSGQPDAWGDPSTIFLLPIIGTLICIGLFYLNRFPHIFNYPQKITENNAKEMYQKATMMMRILNLTTILILTFISYQTIQTALGEREGLDDNILLWVIGASQLPLLYFGIVMYKKKSKISTTTQKE